MKIFSLLIIVLFCFPDSSVALEQQEIVQFEKVESISVQNFWYLREVTSIVSDSGATISYWIFDVENRPIRDDWFAVGVMLMGFGDIGEVPAGVMVWARQPTKLLIDESKEMTSKTGLSHAVFASSKCLNDQECDVTHFQMVMEYDGRVVHNGKIVGIVK